MPLLYCDAATLPSTATPSAAPSSRVASFMAEPAPARRGGTADMIAAVIGDIVSAMPIMSSATHNSTYQYDVLTVSCANEKKPHATRLIPVATVRLAPRRLMMRGVIGDTIIMIGAIG